MQTLYEPLPLRSSTVLGDFEEAFTLARLYGDLSASPTKCNRLSDTEWFLADHAVMGVVGVQIDMQETAGYAVYTDVADGRLYTAIRLAAPAPDGAIVTATCKGMPDPRTGALIDSAEGVMSDILRLSGRAWRSPRLREQALRIPVAGRLRDATISTRAALNEIARSVGAWWTLDDAGLYPGTATAFGTLDKRTSSMQPPVAQLDATARALTVDYGWSEFDDGPLGSVRLAARATRYTGTTTLDCRWLRQAADAEAVGRRVLGRLAGETVKVTLDVQGVAVHPGEFWNLDHHLQAGVMFVTARIAQPGQNDSRIEGEVSMPNTAIDLIGYSSRKPVAQQPGIDVAVSAGRATFTINGADGKPLAGARVSLDGGPAATTTAQGKVTFTATPGRHALAVEAAGFTPFTLQVTV